MFFQFTYLNHWDGGLKRGVERKYGEGAIGNAKRAVAVQVKKEGSYEMRPVPVRNPIPKRHVWIHTPDLDFPARGIPNAWSVST
jgi:hypothetical protein